MLNLTFTDGGEETTILYKTKFPMREFCSFEMVLSEEWVGAWADLHLEYVKLYIKYKEFSKIFQVQLGLPTYKLQKDVCDRLCLPYEETLKRVLSLSYKIQFEHKAQLQKHGISSLISAAVGTRFDGYIPIPISISEAEAYHLPLIQQAKLANIEFINAMTQTNVPEAIGIARGCVSQSMPYAIWFTLETNGRMADGVTRLQSAVEQIDDYLLKAFDDISDQTNVLPQYYGINCTHPEHILDAFNSEKTETDDIVKVEWMKRVKGFRANASNKSHSELNESTTLEDGDPFLLGKQVSHITDAYGMSTVGGCCGTDTRHVEQIMINIFQSNNKLIN